MRFRFFSRALVATVLFQGLLIAGCDRIKPYLSSQIRNEFVHSEQMKASLPLMVVVPSDYETSDNAQTRYPLVLLLHGYGGNALQWQKIIDLTALADRHKIILASPYGGMSSWYFDSPVDPDSKYESHIIHNVITFIDTTYRTLGAGARAITGLSMGGHGALRFISLYPDSFIAAGSMSGILDLRVFPNSWEISEKLGRIEDEPQRWFENSVVNLVSRLKNRDKKIIVDCGTEDFAIAVNRAYRDSAAVHQVPIVYEEGPGGHSAAYWRKRLPVHLEFFQQAFEAAREKKSQGGGTLK